MVTTWIPYFIDYSIQNAAKTIGASKKRVTFKFGIANQKAIEEGLMGAHCRGSEHEVVLIWSLNSGKRHLILDGKDVHFSESGQNGWTGDRAWQHVFALNVPTVGTFKCHFITQAAPQGTTIRPFDLRINGVSIFRFNKIFQLGTASMQARRHNGGGGGGGLEEPVSREEAKHLAMARLESMKDYRKQQETEHKNKAPPSQGAAAAASTQDSLISFENAPPPMPAPMPNRMVSSLTMDTTLGSAYALPPSTNYYGQQGGQAPPSTNYYGQQGGQAPSGAPYQQQPQSNALTAYQGGQQQQQAYPGAPPPVQHNPRYAYTPSSQYGEAPAPPPAFDYASMDPYASPGATLSTSSTPVQSNLQVGAPQQPYGYQQQPQQQPYYQEQPPLQSPVGMSSLASIGTYGSAPSFARPPPNQQFKQPPPPAQQAHYPGYSNY